MEIVTDEADLREVVGVVADDIVENYINMSYIYSPLFTNLDLLNRDILKEAEMIVNNYISKIENNEKKNIFNKEAKVKYSKLKKYAIAITIMSILQAIVIIF